MIDFDQVTGKIGSADFRKRYAALTEPTAVYSNGHYIGTWVPFVLNDLAYARAVAGNDAGVHLRPATPAPKPTKKGR